MVFDYYIQIEKGRKKPGKHLLADNVVVLSAFYTVSSNPKIIYGYLHGYEGGGVFGKSFHKVEFDRAGQMLHHYCADERGDFFYDGVADDSCELPLSEEDEHTFNLLSEVAHSWYPGCADDNGSHRVTPERFDQFERYSKRSNTFTARSRGLDPEIMYDLCLHVGYSYAWLRPEALHEYI